MIVDVLFGKRSILKHLLNDKLVEWVKTARWCVWTSRLTEEEVYRQLLCCLERRVQAHTITLHSSNREGNTEGEKMADRGYQSAAELAR